MKRKCMNKKHDRPAVAELVYNNGASRLFLCAEDLRVFRTEGVIEGLSEHASAELAAQLESGLPPLALTAEVVRKACGGETPEWYAVVNDTLVTDEFRVPLTLLNRRVERTAPVEAPEVKKGGTTFGQMRNSRDALRELNDMVYMLQDSVCSLVNDADLSAEETGAKVRQSIAEFVAAVEGVLPRVLATKAPTAKSAVNTVQALIKALNGMLTPEQALDAVQLAKRTLDTGPVRVEAGMEFPVGAFALVGDASDPETWRFRTWASPDGPADHEQTLVACQAFKAVAARLPDAVRKATAERLKKAWGDAPLPPLLAKDITPVALRKSGLTANEGTFVYEVRPATKVVPGTARLVRLANGISAAMGKLTKDGVMSTLTLVFDNKLFKTAQSAANWLLAHPEVLKFANEPVELNAQQAADAAAWEDSIAFQLPVSGQPQPFVLHALYKGVPPVELDVHKHGDGFPVYNRVGLDAGGYESTFVMRFGTNRKLKSYFGFRCEANPLELTQDGVRQAVLAHPDEGSSVWLRRTAQFLIDRPDNTVTVVEPLDQGTYTLEWASPEHLVVKLAGQRLNGLYVVSGSGDTWLMRRADPSDLADPKGLQPVMRSLDAAKASWLAWPKSRRGGGQGCSVIDVTKTLSNELTYTPVQKEDENAKGEQRYTLGLAYPANRLDSHGDFATPEQLEKTAWTYAVQRRAVGLMHKDGTDGAGTVVESYIYRGPEWKVGDQVIKAGDWLLGVIWNQTAWKFIKSGAFKGFSIQGWAKR